MARRTLRRVEDSPFYQAGAALAALVFAPDYYDGPWYVILNGRRRLCRNYATAQAWAKYLRRQGYRIGVSLMKQRAAEGGR